MNESVPTEYSEYLDTALRAADRARRILFDAFRLPHEVKTKGSHFNLVTEADLVSEKAIVEIIKSRHPDHNLLAEEHEYGKTISPFTWIVDPLDGTNNFAHRLPHYSVSIALSHKQEIVLGVVLDPERGELFQAIRGQGARLNGRPIRVTTAAVLTQSLLITGFYYERGEKMRDSIRKIEKLLSLGIIDIRRFGSAALDLCYVAAGRADGYFEFQLNPWDFAAGLLILEEAGGRVTDWSGNGMGIASTAIAASNGAIHDALLEILQS